MAFVYREFNDGCVINGDCMDPEVLQFVKGYVPEKFAAIVCDPPYGNIVNEKWDKTKLNQEQFSEWMFSWTKIWWPLLHDGGAYYVWGGIGVSKFRPFFVFLSKAEDRDDIEMILATQITWSKRRAYGVQKNYLFTREELAYFVKGRENKPRVFNIPLLDKLRGYDGFNKNYPAKSKFLRRTNVWTDINELFKGKYHSTQKPLKVMEIPIEVNSNEDEWILDMFAGSGATGFAARNLNRKFVLIEQDPEHYKSIVSRLEKFKPGDKLT